MRRSDSILIATALLLFCACRSETSETAPSRGADETETRTSWLRLENCSSRYERLTAAVIDRLANRESSFPADLPHRGEFRRSVAAFLTLYSGTDFSVYAAFRPAQTLPSADSRWFQDVVSGWKEQQGPRPAQPLDVVRTAWDAYVGGGFAPVPAGPVIEEVRAECLEARFKTVPESELQAADWSQAATDACDLAREFEADGVAALRLVVPNASAPAESRNGSEDLIVADVRVPYRTRGATSVVVLRFFWSARDQTWLPLHAVVKGFNQLKPFFW